MAKTTASINANHNALVDDINSISNDIGDVAFLSTGDSDLTTAFNSLKSNIDSSSMVDTTLFSNVNSRIDSLDSYTKSELTNLDSTLSSSINSLIDLDSNQVENIVRNEFDSFNDEVYFNGSNMIIAPNIISPSNIERQVFRSKLSYDSGQDPIILRPTRYFFKKQYSITAADDRFNIKYANNLLNENVPANKRHIYRFSHTFRTVSLSTTGTNNHCVLLPQVFNGVGTEFSVDDNHLSIYEGTDASLITSLFHVHYGSEVTTQQSYIENYFVLDGSETYDFRVGSYHNNLSGGTYSVEDYIAKLEHIGTINI